MVIIHRKSIQQSWEQRQVSIRSFSWQVYSRSVVKNLTAKVTDRIDETEFRSPNFVSVKRQKSKWHRSKQNAKTKKTSSMFKSRQKKANFDGIFMINDGDKTRRKNQNDDKVD